MSFNYYKQSARLWLAAPQLRLAKARHSKDHAPNILRHSSFSGMACAVTKSAGGCATPTGTWSASGPPGTQYSITSHDAAASFGGSLTLADTATLTVSLSLQFSYGTTGANFTINPTPFHGAQAQDRGVLDADNAQMKPGSIYIASVWAKLGDAATQPAQLSAYTGSDADPTPHLPHRIVGRPALVVGSNTWQKYEWVLENPTMSLTKSLSFRADFVTADIVCAAPELRLATLAGTTAHGTFRSSVHAATAVRWLLGENGRGSCDDVCGAADAVCDAAEMSGVDTPADVQHVASAATGRSMSRPCSVATDWVPYTPFIGAIETRVRICEHLRAGHTSTCEAVPGLGYRRICACRTVPQLQSPVMFGESDDGIAFGSDALELRLPNAALQGIVPPLCATVPRLAALDLSNNPGLHVPAGGEGALALGWLKRCRGYILDAHGRDNIVALDDGTLYSTLADVQVDNHRCHGETDASGCTCQTQSGSGAPTKQIQMPDGWSLMPDDVPAGASTFRSVVANHTWSTNLLYVGAKRFCRTGRYKKAGSARQRAVGFVANGDNDTADWKDFIPGACYDLRGGKWETGYRWLATSGGMCHGNLTVAVPYCDTQVLITRPASWAVHELRVDGSGFLNTAGVAAGLGTTCTIGTVDTVMNPTGLPFGLAQAREPIYTARCNGKHTAPGDTNEQVPARSFTVAAWTKQYNVKCPHTTFGVRHGHACQDGAGTTPGWDFGHGYGNGLGTRVCLFDGEHRVDTTLVFDRGYQPRAWVGRWVHLMFVVDRDAGTLAALVNGVRMKHVVDIRSITKATLDPDEGITIATFAPTAHNQQTDGTVDDVRLYDYAWCNTSAGWKQPVTGTEHAATATVITPAASVANLADQKKSAGKPTASTVAAANITPKSAARATTPGATPPATVISVAKEGEDDGGGGGTSTTTIVVVVVLVMLAACVATAAAAHCCGVASRNPTKAQQQQQHAARRGVTVSNPGYSGSAIFEQEPTYLEPVSDTIYEAMGNSEKKQTPHDEYAGVSAVLGDLDEAGYDEVSTTYA